MRTLIIAATLLALASQSVAAASHDQPTKKDVFDVFLAHIDCTRFDWGVGDPGESSPEQDKACKVFERAVEKLNAQGYCVLGHIFIARAGRPWSKKEWERTAPGVDWQKGRKHCYNLKPKRDAQILQYIEQFEKEQPYVSIWKERCKKKPALSVCKANGWDNAQ